MTGSALQAAGDVRIREATGADLDAIVALLADDPLGATREAPGDLAYARAFAAMAAQPGNTLLVATEGAAILGCLQLTVIHGLSRRGMARAQIEGVRVAAIARARGIGRRLVEDAIARARAAGCGLVQLTTDRTRPEAHRFYESLGFEASHLGLKRPL
ncbi:MAG: GNAT family N-acetyltransferase [Pseudomonadota bacterium]